MKKETPNTQLEIDFEYSFDKVETNHFDLIEDENMGLELSKDENLNIPFDLDSIGVKKNETNEKNNL